MEENRCPECGTIMLEEYEKPALNLTCPKCGCKIATTRWEAIDIDTVDYEIIIAKHDSPTMEQIKFISKQTGENFINSKKMLIEGGNYYKGNAKVIKEKKDSLDNNNIQYSISPEYPY